MADSSGDPVGASRVWVVRVCCGLLAVLLAGCTSEHSGVEPRSASEASSSGSMSAKAKPTPSALPTLPPPPGLRGEQPRTQVVRHSGWSAVALARAVFPQGASGRVTHWRLNFAGDRITVYHRYAPENFHPEGSGEAPDICSHRWWTAWRWVGADGRERRWVSVAPASDVVATKDGFLLLATPISHCRARRAKGLTAGDTAWWYLDGDAKLHRLGWAAVASGRDLDVGAVPCGRRLHDTAITRYCTFDPATLTLSPLDFVPQGMEPIGVDTDGRVWVKSDAGYYPGPRYRLAWTDDEGTTWTERRIQKYSTCAQGGDTVVCDDGGGRRWDLSFDRGATWSRTSVHTLVSHLSLPKHLSGPSVGLLMPVVRRSGTLLGLLDDGSPFPYSLVRRARGPSAQFVVVNVPQPRGTTADAVDRQYQDITDESGLLILEGARPLWQSRNEGVTWRRVTLPPEPSADSAGSVPAHRCNSHAIGPPVASALWSRERGTHHRSIHR
jgi:hypothetical protein